jgi:integrase
LHIRATKFNKSRLVPLHISVVEALERYLDIRRRFAGSDDHLFLSVKGTALAYTTVNYTFRRVLRLASMAPGRTRRPRIHDLRHSFATRVLQQCDTQRDASRATLLPWRPIWVTPISRTPTGTFRRRRS